MAKILLVEDDQWLADMYMLALKQARHSIIHANSAQEGIDRLDKSGADIVLLDIMLPGHNGIEVLHELQSYEDWREIPVIILSSIERRHFLLSDSQWKEFGVVKYLYKPRTKPKQVVEAVASVL